jgi:predicted ATP-grasp superfamily ATP-dependent carboligase
MDAFYTNFVEFKDTFKEESQRIAELMVILDAVLTDYNVAGHLHMDEKTLFDMVIELRYGAEKAYKIKHKITDEQTRFFDLLDVIDTEDAQWTKPVRKIVKEAVEAAVKSVLEETK